MLVSLRVPAMGAGPGMGVVAVRGRPITTGPAMSDDILEQLGRTLAQRRGADPETSYTALLMQGGPEAVLRKIGEEATEVVIAGNGPDEQALVHEIADLWFHTLVLLAQRGLGPADVLAELERRSGVSGHDEKAARG